MHVPLFETLKNTIKPSLRTASVVLIYTSMGLRKQANVIGVPRKFFSIFLFTLECIECYLVRAKLASL